ncbi:Glycosyl transferase family protein [Nitrosotalea sinensis]|uniref:Glycosyl transferase family protein n=1 Tax=Nitrosotalea sinensis TaxID=1499975 RepID=A0A2H1EE63_9ARCH|nr:glycosyltransferase [Candidatus Nitrosotalea sinensis]SHO42690.1 Glycosyl transferase family protein [Candidatus Nitrosotalea sinensis]
MKIGIIHGFVGGGGGTEKTLDAIIESLTSTGHTVTLYTISKPSVSFPNVKTVSTLPFHLPAFGLYQRYMESKLVEKAKDDDLVIQASGGLAVPVDENQKLVIYCHHDFQNETKRDTSKYKGMWSWYYKPYYALSKKFLNRISDKNIFLISNSKFIHDSIKEKFSKDSKIIYPPVETQPFQKNTRKTNSAITVSRYSQEKNLEFAVDVFSDVDIDYTIVGNTKTRLNQIYFEKLSAQVKNSKTHLLQNIPRPQVIENLQRSKVYFHASAETFGISVVESIAAGCIPIVPNNSAHRETVPFDQLRYKQDNKQDAQDKIKKALAGDYDKFIPLLQSSLTNYDKNTFKSTFVDVIQEISSTG